MTPAQANASDWVDIGTNMSGNQFWYDASSVIKDKARAVTWVRQTGDNGSYYLSRVLFQCDIQMFKILSMVAYSRGGRTTNLSPSQEFDSVPPDSIYDMISDAVCPASTRPY
jgi:hypothetical protein